MVDNTDGLEEYVFDPKFSFELGSEETITINDLVNFLIDQMADGVNPNSEVVVSGSSQFFFDYKPHAKRVFLETDIRYGAMHEEYTKYRSDKVFRKGVDK